MQADLRLLPTSGLQRNVSVLFKCLALVCLILPFIVFYWLVPPLSSLTIGNDYPIWSIQQQQALMYSLERGAFPLYIPGHAMGLSASALTLGQIFHPLPHLANMFPGYWHGDALLINTQLRLFSLGCVQLLLFYVLKKLGLRTVLAFVLSFITIYNLRTLDMFRYGASLENVTALVILCSCIILCGLEFRRRYIAGVIIGSFLLTVGGHPQIAYIGFLGASTLTLLTPGFLISVQSGVVYDSKRLAIYWSLILLATLVGIILAAPYILGYYFDFLPYNELRTSAPYQFAVGYQDSWGGLFRSFYSPLSSDVHGAFGGSSLIILSLLFPVAILMNRRYWSIAWLPFGVAVLVFLVACGDATPLHRLVWEYFPMASYFRVPGRFTVMILFPLLFVLVWMISTGSEEASGGGKVVIPFLASNLTVLALLASLLFIILNWSIDPMLPASSRWSPVNINDVAPEDFKNGFYLGLAVLLMLAVYAELSARKLRAFAACASLTLAVLVVLEATNALRYGTWVTESRDQQSADAIAAYIQSRYSIPAATGPRMITALMDQQIGRSIIEPRLARFYRNVSVFDNEQDLQRHLLSERKPNEAVIQGSPSSHLYAQSGDEDTRDEVKLTAFRYNQFEYSVTSGADGLLSTNLPFRHNWHVLVDGVTAKAVMANGYETAVFIPAGTHDVLFRYESRATDAGMLVACLSLTLILLFAARSASARIGRVLYFLSSVFPIVLFVVWAASLHDGDRLDVSYSWNTTQFPSSDNLSYAKNASASSHLSYYFYPGLAVDGDINGRPFTSTLSTKPSWKVDLGAIHAVHSIVIHNPLARSLPISVWVSTDDETFTAVAEITSVKEEVAVNFDSTISARFISVRSEQKTVLGFNEVQVIGE